MGSDCCKPEKKGDNIDGEIRTTTVETEKHETPNKNDDEEREVQFLSESLRKDLESFILNHALLGVQFFENYDEEIKQLQKDFNSGNGETTEIEGGKGNERLSHVQVDKVHEHIGTRVTFRPRHGRLKNKESLLHPLRKYIVYQNVHVRSNINTGTEQPMQMQEPYYKLIADDINTKHLFKEGYLNLNEEESKDIKPEVIYDRLLPRPHTPKLSSSSEVDLMNDCSSESESEHYATPNLLAPPPLPLQEPPAQYGYTTIQSLTSSQPLNETRLGTRPTNSASIPRACFETKEIENIYGNRRAAHGGHLFYTVTLLSASKFVHHFLDVLAEHLATPLHLETNLNTGAFQGARVVCHRGKASIYIIPVFHLGWWPNCADEYMRPYSSTNKTLIWPTYPLKKKTKRFGCYVIPFGYLKLRGKNADFPTQWRIIHPKAEQFLLLHTMHSHIRCYQFLLAIWKTFLQVEGTCLALDETHILHLLFWEIHNDFLDWPKVHEWERLKYILQKLYQAIQTRYIGDFFIHDRNLLRSVPSIFLNDIQSRLQGLMDNPVPYILLALKNLQMRAEFYPKLNYSHLYKLATVPQVLLYLNPNLARKTKKETVEFDQEDEVRAWKQKAQEERKREKKLEKLKKTVSVETINLEGKVTAKSITERDANTALRHKEIINTFILHYFLMSKKSIEFKAIKQARLYIRQIARLIALLELENLEQFEEIAKFRENLEKLIENCDKSDNDHGSVEGRELDNQQLQSRLEERISLHDRELPDLPKT